RVRRMNTILGLSLKVCCVSCALYQLYGTTAEYLRGGDLVEIEIESNQWQAEMPAITICDERRRVFSANLVERFFPQVKDEWRELRESGRDGRAFGGGRNRIYLKYAEELWE